MRRARAAGRPGTITATGDGVPVALLVAGLVLLALIVAPFVSMLSALPAAEHGALLSRGTLGALWTTVVAAGVAILADVALGVPLAYWMARSRSRMRHLAMIASLLPLAVPPVVGGLELVLWLGPYGWLGRWLLAVGLNPLDTIRGTILAQMFIAAPFVIVTARAAFAGVDPAVTDAARSLGCGRWATLVRVTLPAARRGIAAGLVLGWLRAVGEFGASIVVAYHPYTLSNLVYVQLSGRGLRTALPTAVLLTAFGVAAALLLTALDADRRPRRRPGAGAVTPEQDAHPATEVPTLTWIQPLAPGSQPAGEVEVALTGRVGEFALDVALRSEVPTVAILGSSGAGKSLTLRTVAGLLRPPSGRVVLAGRPLLDTAAGIHIPAERRGFAYVSQADSLFRHLDVAGNVGFALQGIPVAERADRVAVLLEVFGLTALARARPCTLSGGERQRVALARALAPGPSALLLDEPFSSLDADLRRDLRAVIRGIHEATGVPLLVVTHDRDDALSLADFVVVMDRGRVVQQGRTEEVFTRPATPTVARLVGIPNVVPVGTLLPDGPGRVVAETAWGLVAVGAPPEDEPTDGGWAVAVPPAAVSVTWAPPGVAVTGECGAGLLVTLRPGATGWCMTLRQGGGDARLEVLVPASDGARPVVGAPCRVAIDGARCHLMASRVTAMPAAAQQAEAAVEPDPVGLAR